MAKYKYARPFMNMKDQDIHKIAAAEKNMQSGNRPLIQHLKRITFSPAFKNVTRNDSDMLVMYTFLYIAFIENSLELRLSCREVAAIVGIGHVTASKAIKRLVEYGLLKVIKSKFHPSLSREELAANVRSARRYKITMQDMFLSPQRTRVSDKSEHIDSTTCSYLSLRDMTAPEHEFYEQINDIFWNGFSWVHGEQLQRLGKAAGNVYAKLKSHQQMTSNEIAELVGHSLRTVQRALSRLKLYNMVYKVGDCWSVNPIQDDFEVAHALDLVGKKKKHFMKYIRQSEEHHRLMELWVNDYEKYAEIQKEKEKQRKARNTVTVTENGELVTRRKAKSKKPPKRKHNKPKQTTGPEFKFPDELQAEEERKFVEEYLNSLPDEKG
jgi:predicted transcriptional regulator